MGLPSATNLGERTVTTGLGGPGFLGQGIGLTSASAGIANAASSTAVRGSLTIESFICVFPFSLTRNLVARPQTERPGIPTHPEAWADRSDNCLAATVGSRFFLCQNVMQSPR